MPRPPTRPRNAAALVVMRGRGPRAEVLLGRREPRDRFMPGVYVFPGGRVDRRDAAAPAASELRPAVTRRLRGGASPGMARALAVAALRETWEETGLAFGSVESGQLVPELDHLEYLGRAITPTANPIRYHARFFLTRADRADGRIRSNGELLDLRWVPIPEVADLPVIDVTKLVLREVAHHAEDRPTDRAPRISYYGHTPRIRYE